MAGRKRPACGIASGGLSLGCGTVLYMGFKNRVVWDEGAGARSAQLRQSVRVVNLKIFMKTYEAHSLAQ